MSLDYYHFVKRKFRDRYGNYQLKTLKTNIVTVPLEMLLSKGNPLLPRIDEILLMTSEFGLIGYWTQKITMRHSADEKEQHQPETVLTFDNLRGGFLLWFVGILLATMAFCGELLYFRWNGPPSVNM